jgi:hypothetical protein
MRSGGKGMWGRGPALYKHNFYYYIFTAAHSVFLHQIDRGALPSTRRGFFPAYRMGTGKNSDMVGKIPPWRWDMVGKNPTKSEKFRHGRNKRQGGVHEGIINQVILFKFPYMGTYPNSILNPISYVNVLFLVHLCP